MRRFLVTWMATGLAVTLVLIHFLAGVDFFNVAGRLLEHMSWSHLDEEICAVLIIVTGFGIDAFLARQRKVLRTQIQAHRVMVFKATMRSTHELVNDALNQMQLFILEAEGLIPDESLKSFDDLIHRTAAALIELGNLDSAEERDTPLGRSIEYRQPAVAEV